MTSDWFPGDSSDPSFVLRLAVVFRAVSPMLAATAPTRDADDLKNDFVRGVHRVVRGECPPTLGDLSLMAVEAAQSLRKTATGANEHALLDQIEAGCAVIVDAEHPFGSLLDVILDQARRVTGSLIDVDFRLRPLRDTTRFSTSPPFSLSGLTSWTGDDPTVELGISAPDFAPATFAVVPYVLAHEVLCHAFSGHRESPTTSIMAEGVMDWASHWFCERWLHLLPPGCALDARCHAAPFQTQSHRDRRVRKLGHQSAATLTDYLTTLGVPDVEASARVAQAAVALNVSARSLAEKDLLVTEWAGVYTDPDLAARVRLWVDDPSALPDLLF